MNPCSDFDWYEASGIESIDRVAQAHMNVTQFFCPSAFDLSFYGTGDDVLKKTLFVDVKTQDDAYLDGKYLGVLLNSREPEFFDDYEQVRLKNFTQMHWMSVNSRTPMTNLVTYQNHEFYMKETEYDQYKVELNGVQRMEWLSVEANNIVTTPYTFPVANPTVKGQIIFQTSHDLHSKVHRSDRIFFINIMGQAGGTFFAISFIISLFFKLWVSWLMHLTIVRNLFKIDPN